MSWLPQPKKPQPQYHRKQVSVRIDNYVLLCIPLLLEAPPAYGHRSRVLLEAINFINLNQNTLHGGNSSRLIIHFNLLDLTSW